MKQFDERKREGKGSQFLLAVGDLGGNFRRQTGRRRTVSFTRTKDAAFP